MHRIFSALRVRALAVTLAVTIVAPLGAAATHRTVTYDYLIGVAPLCDLAPGACPVLSVSRDGDTIELTGAGTFSIHPKSVTGGGTFVHKNAEGEVIGTGTWTATDLLFFRSYGSGAVQGLPEEFEGGTARIRVRLIPDGGGEGFNGVLKVVCTLGDDIPSSAVEGIRLRVIGGENFSDEVSGFTLFVRTGEGG